jgi:UDP-3-O-[3-hydroxymyristoyl] glucosamine N-acyltransferase
MERPAMQSRPGTAPAVTLSELARRLGVDPPAEDRPITGVNTIEEAGPTEITFLSNEAYVQALQASRAGAVLVATTYDGRAPMPMLRTENPRLAFARLVEHFHRPPARRAGVHATAVVADSCVLGSDVAIGAYAVLGERVRVGDGTTIHPHCVIYDDVTMGAACELHSHVTIREGVELGDRVVLQSGAVIGADGFGFEPDENGSLRKVPQVGTVRLGDDVEVQANACVDRAAIGATVIGRGAKIDNLVQVAHGCKVGEHAILCGQVGLAGSTRIGNRAMLGGQVGSSGHITVGDGAQVAAQSGIITNLEAGKSYGGTPAMELKDALRSALYLPRLPEMARGIKKLEREVAALREARQDG